MAKTAQAGFLRPTSGDEDLPTRRPPSGEAWFEEDGGGPPFEPPVDMRPPPGPRAVQKPPGEMARPATMGSARVRGPAEARAARAHFGGSPTSHEVNTEEEPLPPGAKGADFRTLHQMIAQEIKVSEAETSRFENDFRPEVDDLELQRHREAVRKRREQEAEARQREKEQAKERRHRENEARRRRLEQELLQLEPDPREGQEASQAQCKREFRAASRIQARWRGRTSRSGRPFASPVVKASLHSQPWSEGARVH